MHMQLRKRKRVNYTGRKLASDPSSTTTIPSIVVPKRRKLSKPEMAAPAMPNISATLNPSNIIIPKPLQRPKFRNITISSSHDEREMVPVLEVQKTLTNLIKRQEHLFYKDLHKPTLVGLKNFEMLRLPNDLQLLQNIINLLHSFDQLNKDSKVRPVSTTLPKAFSQVHSNNLKKLVAEKKLLPNHPNHDGITRQNDTIIHEIADLHSITLIDLLNLEMYNNIGHTNSSVSQTTGNSMTVNSIIKKLDKPILKERNNTLVWPHKSRFKAKKNQSSQNGSLTSNTNLTLYNDI
ncbi:YPL068C [Saccharomyces arboricola H-6]|uniref:YPL068C n=1 Tax=Saccharomyces arboricola (strain H-6 / AS 2.3317 / CBS 10644) TaxID=1160507 RepID=J8LH47_SACAR|nr:YPL068C [Saccharomyces arboricola H-6]